MPVRLQQNPQQAMFLTSSTVALVSLRFASLWYLDLPSHLRCHPGHRLQLFLYHKTEMRCLLCVGIINTMCEKTPLPLY